MVLNLLVKKDMYRFSRRWGGCMFWQFNRTRVPLIYCVCQRRQINFIFAQMNRTWSRPNLRDYFNKFADVIVSTKGRIFGDSFYIENSCHLIWQS